MRISTLFATLALVFTGMTAHAAEPVKGPVIENYGPIFAVPDDSFNNDAGPFKITSEVIQ